MSEPLLNIPSFCNLSAANLFSVGTLSKMFFLFFFLLQVIVDWYFAKPNWYIESIGYSGIQYQVPLKVVLFTESGQTTMSVFNFNPVVFATEPRVFNIKPCFTLEEQRLVRFSLNGKLNLHLPYWLSTNLSFKMVLSYVQGSCGK